MMMLIGCGKSTSGTKEVTDGSIVVQVPEGSTVESLFDFTSTENISLSTTATITHTANTIPFSLFFFAGDFSFSAFPHLLQYFAPSGFSVPHFLQSIYFPPHFEIFITNTILFGSRLPHSLHPFHNFVQLLFSALNLVCRYPHT